MWVSFGCSKIFGIFRCGFNMCSVSDLFGSRISFTLVGQKSKKDTPFILNILVIFISSNIFVFVFISSEIEIYLLSENDIGV